MIELKPLTYFVAAYEEGSLTAASNRCFIAQPSISHAIKSLETKLGTQLFQRSKKGLLPTSDGHRLYESAKGLLAQSQRVVQQFAAQPPCELKIFAQPDVQLARYQRIFQHWQQRIPNLHLTLVPELNQADCAFVDAAQASELWGVITLEKEDYIAVMPSDYPLACQSHVSLSDLHGQRLIERPYCLRQQAFEKRLLAQHIHPVISAKAQHEQQAIELIKLGFGLALFPRNAFISQPGLCAIELDTSADPSLTEIARRQLVMAYRRNQHVVSHFVDSLPDDIK